MSADKKKPSDPPRLAFIKDPSGRLLLAAFTDEQTLRANWTQDGEVYRAPAEVFASAALQGPFAGLIVNRGTATSVVITRTGLMSLAQTKLPDDALDGSLIEPRST